MPVCDVTRGQEGTTLQIVALSAVRPIGLERRALRAVSMRAGTVLRLMLGFGLALLAYFGVLVAVFETCSAQRPLEAVIFGLGFSLATVLAVLIGMLASPDRLARTVIRWTCAFAVFFPVVLNGYVGSVGKWQPIYLLYLLGSIWGGYAVAWLMCGRGGLSRARRL